MAAAIDQAAEAIVITDLDGSILYVNPAFTRVTGYGSREAIGQNPRVLKSGTQNPAYYRNLWETIRGGVTWKGELINRRKDGTTYTEEMTITPVRDSCGDYRPLHRPQAGRLRIAGLPRNRWPLTRSRRPAGCRRSRVR